MHFVIFHLYDTLTFKTKTLHFASNEGQLKRLLLPYIRLIQPYLSLLWLLLATYFVIRVTPIDSINSKSHTMELKSSRNYSTYHLKSKSCHYLWPLGWTHIHTHTYTYFGKMKLISRNQARAVAGACLV